MNFRSIFSTVAKKFSCWYQSRANGFRSIGAGPVIGAMLALALYGPSGIQAGTLTFQQGVSGYTGTGDTTLAAGQGGDPNTNYGTDPTLSVFERETNLNNLRRDAIRYDLSSVAPGTTITSATLTLYQDYSGGNLGVINSLYVVAAADKAWTGTSATWNKAVQSVPTPWAGGPGLSSPLDYNATPVATAASPAPGGFDSRSGGSVYAMTLTLNAAGIAAIQDWINTPSDNSGFFMRQPDGSFSVDEFASSHASTIAQHPLLTLTFVPEPSTLVLTGIAGVLMLSWRRRSNFSRSSRGQAKGFRAIGAGPVIGAILALALCGSSSIQANTISFQNGVSGYTGTRDTYIAGGANAVNNYGTDAVLGIYERETATSNFDRTLIGYDLSSVTPGTTVTGATLTLYQQYGGGNQGVINSLYVLAAADAGWTQSGATWNNTNGPSTPWAGGSGLSAPNDYGTPVATEASPGTGFADLRGVSGVPMTFTLDAAGIAVIQDWINNPADNSGFFIRQPDGSFSVDLFASSSASNAASLHPLLTLTTVPEPSTLVLAGIAGVLMLSWRRRSK